MGDEHEYVLGTHEAEVARLHLQHQVWRPEVIDVWRRARFDTGHTLLDVGCGPGFAAVDLAGIVGRQGRVIAVDKSQRFLSTLRSTARAISPSNIECHHVDLDGGELPDVVVDGAWVRWVFAFLHDPRRLVDQLAGRLRAGGTLAIHEYLHYGTWRATRRSRELEDFVQAVIASCQQTGGNWDIGLELPGILEDSGFVLRQVRPILDVVGPGHEKWRWMKAFVDTGRQRLLELGLIDPVSADRLGASMALWEQPTSRQLLVTPAVIEIVAVRT